MINRKRLSTNDVRLTFSLTEDRPVSVVTDRFGWDPMAHPMAKRSNGLRSASIEVPKGTEVRFRYLVDGGQYLDDADADWHLDNGMGSEDNVVVASISSDR